MVETAQLFVLSLFLVANSYAQRNQLLVEKENAQKTSVYYLIRHAEKDRSDDQRHSRIKFESVTLRYNISAA